MKSSAMSDYSHQKNISTVHSLGLVDYGAHSVNAQLPLSKGATN